MLTHDEAQRARIFVAGEPASRLASARRFNLNGRNLRHDEVEELLAVYDAAHVIVRTSDLKALYRIVSDGAVPRNLNEIVCRIEQILSETKEETSL